MKKALMATLALLLATTDLVWAQTNPSASSDSEPVRLVASPATPSAKGVAEPLTLPPVKNSCGPTALSTPSDCEACGYCCPQKCSACPGPYGWFRAEYLVWWLKGYDVPPLVTTGPPNPQAVGFLGNPGTQVLLGGDSLDQGTYQGGRFTAGFFLDPCNTCGIEASYFFLGQQGDTTSFSSAQFPVLARPFFNLNLGSEFSQVVAFPGIATGSVTIDDDSSLQGADVNILKALCCCCKCDCAYQINALAGFRYLDLDEGLSIREELDIAPGAPLPGLAGRHITVLDSFATRNQFYGGQVGVSGWGVWSGFLLDVRALLALGSTVQTLDIVGNQVVSGGGLPPVPSTGGLLALPSNIGSFSRSQFAVVPEITINVGYQLSQNLRAFVGYNFLYWSDVIRPGNQIDRVLNANQIPNFGGPFPAAPVAPLVTFCDSDFWAQGLNFGVQVQW
jgi:hypothetical protein